MSIVSISFRAGAEGTIAVPSNGGTAILAVARNKAKQYKAKPFYIVPLTCKPDLAAEALKVPYGGYNETIEAAKALLNKHGFRA